MGETNNGGAAGAQLRSIVQRLENLIGEKKDLANDIRDVFDEAGSNGFDKKVIRKILAARAMAESERVAQEEIFDLYAHHLGMRRGERGPPEQKPFEETPLGETTGKKARPTTTAVVPNREKPVEAEIIEPDRQQLAAPLKRLAGPARH